MHGTYGLTSYPRMKKHGLESCSMTQAPGKGPGLWDNHHCPPIDPARPPEVESDNYARGGSATTHPRLQSTSLKWHMHQR